jgi:hypothetical protein
MHSSEAIPFIALSAADSTARFSWRTRIRCAAESREKSFPGATAPEEKLHSSRISAYGCSNQGKEAKKGTDRANLPGTISIRIGRPVHRDNQ